MITYFEILQTEEKTIEKKAPQVALRSEAVKDIISRPPHWLVRWGVTSVFIVLILVLIASWVIKYPEVIAGPALVKSENPVVVKSSLIAGRITQVEAQDGEMVAEGAPLLSIENALSPEDYRFLSQFLGMLDSIPIKEMNRSQFAPDTTRNYGTLQRGFNELASAFLSLKEFRSRSIDSTRAANLENQIANYERLAQIAMSQVFLARQEMMNAREKYAADQQLYEEGVYAKMDFMQMETQYRDKLSALENAKQAETQHRITLADYQKQYEELKYALGEEERQLTVALQNAKAALQSDLKNWEQSFSLKADKAGKVSALTELFAGRTVQAGEPLVAIVPENQRFYVSTTVPPANFGRVEKGQAVNLKLANYNWQEFGMLKGRVAQVSEVPTELGYRVQIELNEQREGAAANIQLKPEMAATAEIQTQDLRLIERLFYQIKKLFDRDKVSAEESAE